MNDTLVHYGIPGQKWGRRRYQNEDGTLTKAGIERYNKTHVSLDRRGDESKQYRTYKRLSTTSNPHINSIMGGKDDKSRPQMINRDRSSYLEKRLDQRASGRFEERSTKKDTENGKNLLNIQSKTTRKEGIPIEEYNKMANRNVAEKVLDIRDRTSREEGIPIDEYNEKQNKKILNKITAKIKDVSQSTIQNGKNAVEKILNTIKKATTKMKDVSKQVVSTIKNKVNQILNIQEKSTTKRLTQRELDDEVVKIAYGVKKRGGRA